MAEKESAPKRDFQSEVTFLLIGLFLLSIIINRLMAYLAMSNPAGWLFHILSAYVWPFMQVMLLFVGVVALVGAIHVYRKLYKLNKEEKEIYGSPTVAPLEGDESLLRNDKWEHIVELINSNNASDWRLAVIEADVMLEDVMRRAGYHGDTLGDMLKSVERSDMPSIDSAWKAHKVRNAIAHEGQDYPFNEREAKQAIAHFEEVFREFKVI